MPRLQFGYTSKRFRTDEIARKKDLTKAWKRKGGLRRRGRSGSNGRVRGGVGRGGGHLKGREGCGEGGEGVGRAGEKRSWR